jgi:hypothetical protein
MITLSQGFSQTDHHAMTKYAEHAGYIFYLLSVNVEILIVQKPQ